MSEISIDVNKASSKTLKNIARKTNRPEVEVIRRALNVYVDLLSKLDTFDIVLINKKTSKVEGRYTL